MTLRRNAVANYAGQIWTTVIGLVFVPVYIKYVGIEAYGLIGVFAVIQTWLSVFDLGLTPSISREMARFTAGGHDAQSIRDMLRTVETIIFLVAAAATLALWGGAGWLASEWLVVETLPHEVVVRALAITGLVVGLRFAENVYRSSIVGLQRQVLLNWMVCGLATLRAVGAVAVLAWIAPTITAFFVWQAIASALSVLALAFVTHHALPRAPRRARFSRAQLAGIWKFAAGTVAMALLGFVLSQSDKVILTKMLTLSEFAVYSLVFTAAGSVRLLGQPIDQAVFPRLTQLFEQNSQGELSRLYHTAVQYNAALMGGVGVFLAVFGEPVLRLWTQDAAIAAQGRVAVGILSIGMVLNALMNGPYYLQVAAGWVSLLVRVNAVMVAIFVPTIYVLTQRFGMNGAATAWLVLNLTYVLTIAPFMHKRLLPGELSEWYFRDLLLPLATAGLVAGTLRLILPTGGGLLLTGASLVIALAATLAGAAAGAGRVRSHLMAHRLSPFRAADAVAPADPALGGPRGTSTLLP